MNVCGYVIALSIAMIGHLEQLINLFRFAVSVPSHRRIHSAWRFFKGDRTESTTGTIADLASPLRPGSRYRARKSEADFLIVFSSAARGARLCHHGTREDFPRNGNGNALNEKRIPRHYRCACGK